MKKLILITGPSTAGKTTLLRAMGKAIPNGRTLVQAACREARSDDDPRFIKVYNENDFQNTDLWLKHGQFGLAQSEIDEFLQSESEIGFCVVGVRELAQARDKSHPALDVHTVLVRMNADPIAEAMNTGASIATHFEAPEKRLEQNTRLLRDFFLNAEFIQRNIDLVLYRENSLADWLDKVSERFGLSHAITDGLCEEAVLENKASRPLSPPRFIEQVCLGS